DVPVPEPLVEFGRPLLAVAGVSASAVGGRYKAQPGSRVGTPLALKNINGDTGRCRMQLRQPIRHLRALGFAAYPPAPIPMKLWKLLLTGPIAVLLDSQVGFIRFGAINVLCDKRPGLVAAVLLLRFKWRQP